MSRTGLFLQHMTRQVEIYEILGKLDEVVKKKKYVAETAFGINSVDCEEQNLQHHSENSPLHLDHQTFLLELA